jgi:hypothetical protein
LASEELQNGTVIGVLPEVVGETSAPVAMQQKSRHLRVAVLTKKFPYLFAARQIVNPIILVVKDSERRLLFREGAVPGFFVGISLRSTSIPFHNLLMGLIVESRAMDGNPWAQTFLTDAVPTVGVPA